MKRNPSSPAAFPSAPTAAGLLALCCLLFPAGAATASDADWPQYRFDAQRSAYTPAELPSDLSLLWVRELPAPEPAFPEEIRLLFDRSYEPVAMDGILFLPSMVSDTVTALDAATGEEKWVHFTGGPVRFAPTAGDGKVYAASDDGYLHCLDAESGELLWKFRGLPPGREDRKVLGSQRLISLWAARGGPVLDDGVVYFAAGLWPQDGIFVHALDAATGEARWSNTTSDQLEEANMDHGVAQYAGLTPQGYLARVHDHLVVPCGVQLAAFLDPGSGELSPYAMGWGGRVGLPKGTWFAAGAGSYLSASGDLYDVTRPSEGQEHRDITPYMTEEVTNLMYPGGWTRLSIDPANQRTLGNFNRFETRRDEAFIAAADPRALEDFRRPVLTPGAVYFNDREHGLGIAAYDLNEVRLEERSGFEPTIYRSADRYPDKWKGVFRLLWNLPSEAEVHIGAGGRLYAGDEGVVLAIDMPSGPGGEARVSWSAEIEGVPHTMLAAADKLFVVTREGRLYAFGEGAGEPVRHAPPAGPAEAGDRAAELAEEILEAGGAREGYAVVLGLDEGELVEALLARSALRIVAVDADADRVRRVRERLHRLGLYGMRATVVEGDPLACPLPPFLAHLVLSENPAALGEWWASPRAEAVFRILRPYGGTAVLAAGEQGAEEAAAALLAAGLPNAVASAAGDHALLSREGSLPGAAGWTHSAADAAHSGASQDRFVRGPLDVLWFDSSFRWNRKPGFAEVRVAGGRVVVKSDRLQAIDAYTGRAMWSAELPESLSGETHLVATGDLLYLAPAEEPGPCLLFDPENGERLGEIPVPPGREGPWSEIRVWGERLVAAFGPELVCLDRRSGEVLWSFTCDRPALAVAAGNGKVFCSELLNPRRESSAEEAGTLLRAFDIESGEELWETFSGVEFRYAEEMDWIVTASDIFDGADGTRLADGAEDAQIAGNRLISGTRDSFTVFELSANEPQPRGLEWSRRGCTDLRASPHLVTTRFRANSAYIDLASLEITPLWNIRPGCRSANNLVPADGLLNVPNVTGGCECNYTPVSKAFVPRRALTAP